MLHAQRHMNIIISLLFSNADYHFLQRKEVCLTASDSSRSEPESLRPRSRSVTVTLSLFVCFLFISHTFIIVLFSVDVNTNMFMGNTETIRHTHATLWILHLSV